MRKMSIFVNKSVPGSLLSDIYAVLEVSMSQVVHTADLRRVYAFQLKAGDPLLRSE